MHHDKISSRKYFLRCRGACLTWLVLLAARPQLSAAQSPPPLFTPAPTFSATNHYVAISVFQWFTSNGGQLTGPWRPIEGRSNWTGTPDFWKGQIKQMMAANIDVLYVHLIPSSEAQRTNLFIALNQLRAEGYDTPKVAPFLDPMITWYQKPLVNLATNADKDEFVGQYIRFYNQYFGVSTGAYADDYLARQDNKPILDTWHVKLNCSNLNALTRDDVSNRLVAALGTAHPYFTNGFVMVTTALNPPTLSFADEKVPQFEIHAYYFPSTLNSIGSVQLKGGYWDQNIRNPGYLLPRAGGVNYSNAWNQVNRATTSRVYLESWNEYDEGSGMYAGTNLPPYIAPANTNGNTDVWSTTGDPFEYIKTTARGAASFNDTPWQSAKFLWHNFPTNLVVGETRSVTVIVRNDGDASWTAAGNYQFGEKEAVDPVLFGLGNYLLNDAQDEIPIYGGIFRGRPKTFQLTLTAPAVAGSYLTHWGMLQEGVGWFGEELVIPITVKPKTAATVTLGNLAWTYNGTARRASATTTPSGLTVNLTYNASANAPTNAGSYTVIGTINDLNYQGSATNTLVIAKATATVTLGSLLQTYNGMARSASATTAPSGLTVNFTYNGSANAPTTVGSYTVIGTVNEVNYQGGKTNTLVISKATTTVTLGSLAQTYTGTARSASATTTPSGLTVSFTYNGSANAPTNVGNYTVISTVNDLNYQGSATNTLVIGKATATVTLGSLAQTYTGTARSASATTTPSGLTVSLTYDGSADAPTNAGSYLVVGTISDTNYQGSATDTLAINLYLTNSISGGDLILTWSSGTLLEATNVLGLWMTNAATSPYTNAIDKTRKEMFYRLIQ